MPHTNRFCILSVLVGIVLIAPAVFAATIGVTTTDDVVSIDGQCSLREAVSAANLNMPFSDCPTGEVWPIIDVIELPPGTYALTLEPAGEDMNAGGDLDIMEAVTVRGLGDDFIWWDDPDTPDVEVLDVFSDPTGFPRDFTEDDLPDVVIENGLGKPSTPGDGDRVFHLRAPPPPPSPAPERGPVPPSVITFENLGIAGGDASCAGADCNPGAAGIFHEIGPDLTLRRVALFDHRVSCSEPDCGIEESGVAIAMSMVGDLRILESVVAKNVATCADTGCETSRIVFHRGFGLSAQMSEIDQSLITGNTARCTASDCDVNELLWLGTDAQRWTQSVVTRNDFSCDAAGFECNVQEIIDLNVQGTLACSDPSCFHETADVEVSENRSRCDGFRCQIDELIDVQPHHQTSLTRLRVRNNDLSCSGFSCTANQMMTLTADSGDPSATATLHESEFLDNLRSCEGTRCETDQLIFFRGMDIGTLSGVSVRNDSSCVGDDCDTAQLLLLQSVASVTDLTITDSTLTCTGTACAVDPALDMSAASPLSPVVTGLIATDNHITCSGTPCGPAIDGGGIARFGSSRPPRPTYTLDNATITGNVTVTRGVLGSNARLDIIDSTISGNTSSADGGAIFNGQLFFSSPPTEDDAGILSLVNTAVDGNLASGVGGAIVNPPDASLTISGGSIAGNLAMDGGGIWNEGTLTFVSGGPFADNTPNDCVNAGDGTGCIDLIFLDGFETGDTSAWSSATRAGTTP